MTISQIFFEVKCFCLVRQFSNFFFMKRHDSKLQVQLRVLIFPVWPLFFRKRGCWTLAHWKLISGLPLSFLSLFIAGGGPNRGPNVRSLPLNPLVLKKSPLSTHTKTQARNTWKKSGEIIGTFFVGLKKWDFFFCDTVVTQPRKKSRKQWGGTHTTHTKKKRALLFLLPFCNNCLHTKKGEKEKQCLLLGGLRNLSVRPWPFSPWRCASGAALQPSGDKRDEKKKSISPIIYSNLFTFTCGKPGRSGHGKCCSSGSWTWGECFRLDHPGFFGVHQGKTFSSKGVHQAKTFPSKGVHQAKTFPKRGASRTELFHKGVRQGQNFVKERGASRTKLSSKIWNPQ